MTAPTETWYFRTLADDVLDTVNKGYEIDPAHIVRSLRSAADQIDHLTAERDQARQKLAEQAVLEVHHHDLEAHAASFNEGWNEAVRQGLAELRRAVRP